MTCFLRLPAVVILAVARLRAWRIEPILVAGVLWLGLTSCASAATPLRFSHLSVEHGLTQTTVQAILQDHVGYLWLGTEEGLNRYDGYTVHGFKHDNAAVDSLPDNKISALYEDRRKQLWIGTATGLCWYDRPTETFHRLPEIKAKVTTLAEDNKGNLWIGVEGYGVYARAPDTGKLMWYQKVREEPGSFSSYVASFILSDGRGTIWIGTYDAGLERFDGHGHFIHYRHDNNNPDSLTHDQIWNLAEDSDGKIWIATYGGGLDLLDPDTGKFVHHRHREDDPSTLGSDLLTRVLVDRQNTVWAGTDGAGLQRYDRTTDHFTGIHQDPNDPASLSQDVVRTLYEDNSGRLWIGLYLGGADLLRQPLHPFFYYTHRATDPTSPSDPSVASFLEDAQGRVWIGMERGWLDRWDKEHDTFVHYRFTSDVAGGAALLALHQDRHGRIWVGTYRGGLARFDDQTGKFTTYRSRTDDPKSLSDDEVWAIAEDDEGMLWLGTNEGVDRFDPDLGVVTSHHATLPAGGESNTGVRSLLFDHERNLWIGTIGGLSLLRHGADKLVWYRHDEHDPHSLSHDSVVALAEDQHARLWVGTYGGGINQMNTANGTFVALRGFPSDVVYRIEPEASGRLWVSTNQGLSRFDPTKASIESFDLTNGLQSLQSHLGASLHLRDGHLLFGSVDGFYHFDPNAIVPDPHAPPVVLTGIRVFNEPLKLPAALSSRREITLKPTDKVVSIEFSALDYSFPRRNHYAYAMEGFSPRWLDLGLKREVTFTNLDPGTYFFRVKASNSDGVWNDSSFAELKIVVRPPLWATWWFRCGSVVLLTASIFSLHRRRVRRLTADLQKRNLAERALRQAEEKYRELVEDIDEIIFSTDAEGRVTYISPVVKSVLGYDPEEIIGRPFFTFVPEEDWPSVRQALRSRTAAPSSHVEHRMTAKAGGARWMRCSSRPIVQHEQVLGLRGVLTDVTDRKKLEDQLRQSQKMDAIGRLAGGVAHDFNNLLTGIISYSELLVEDPLLHHEARENSTEIRNAGQRAAALTRQLLTFSRRQFVQPRELDLNALVAGMEKMLQRLIGEDVHLHLQIDPNLGTIKADPSQIEQVILNLAINSRDAMPRGGQLNIETANFNTESGTSRFSEVPPGHYIQLIITDTGCGMDADVQSHLFEPFFTTKEIGKGTGLGLSTVYAVVKQSGGHIVVSSETGVGTTFRIFFPRVEKTIVASAAPLSASGQLARGTGTVLLVEDNDVVRKIARQVLQQCGFRILEATNGAEALLLYEQHNSPLVLLLTDVIMPGLNGREVAERLSARCPTMKVLFMTGYTDDAIVRHGGLAAGTALLEKPFTPEVLLRKVKEVLG